MSSVLSIIIADVGVFALEVANKIWAFGEQRFSEANEAR
jgi:hypothetical protein